MCVEINGATSPNATTMMHGTATTQAKRRALCNVYLMVGLVRGEQAALFWGAGVAAAGCGGVVVIGCSQFLLLLEVVGFSRSDGAASHAHACNCCSCARFMLWCADPSRCPPSLLVTVRWVVARCVHAVNKNVLS
jgi:hypothetical protein